MPAPDFVAADGKSLGAVRNVTRQGEARWVLTIGASPSEKNRRKKKQTEYRKKDFKNSSPRATAGG